MIDTKLKEVSEREYHDYMKESVEKAKEEQELKESLLARKKQE